jgi:hypothetical protein
MPKKRRAWGVRLFFGIFPPRLSSYDYFRLLIIDIAKERDLFLGHWDVNPIAN